MIRNLSRDDVADILYGATFFGAGGGGELDEGLALVDLALAAGKQFRMVALDDVPDDALCCMPYLLGAISDVPQGDAALVNGVHPIMLAFERIKTYFDQPIYGTYPCEMGGSNTAVPFFVAAMADAVVLDADPAGRAVPEIIHSTLAIAGLPPSPIIAANARGETMVLENIADDQRAEDVVRALAQTSQNDISAIDHVLPAKSLRPAILHGTLSAAGRLGKLWRETRSNPKLLPDTIAQAANGAVLFKGRVTASQSRTEGGFTLGSFQVEGTDQFDGDTFRVDLKNENMIGWLNEEPIVTIPEIITVLDLTTGNVVTNPNINEAQSIAILVLPAPEPFLTPAGMAIFGPKYAGLTASFKSALPDTI